VILIGILTSYNLAIRRYELHSPKIGAPIRLLLITDLHSCYYGKNQTTLVKAIEAQRPDALMFCGDIADDKIPIDNTRALLEAVADRYPCFYVTGNHEFWGKEVEAVKRLFNSYGVTVLEGEHAFLSIRGEEIIVCGVDDPESGKFSAQLASAAEGTEIGPYSVLLSHRPELFAQYAQYHFDLVLAGHAHGGLWRIPGLLNGLVAPNQGFFPKYTGGQYSEQSSIMIVSRGLARESTLIPRMFNRPELVVVDLRPPAQN
jgi:predicted MPP superfamily phosphohydrolase